MFFFYNLLFYLLHPFLLIFLKFRVMIGKEDKERYIEKIGYTKCVSPGVIWFHVASLGEIKSIHPIIKFYQNKNLEILITSVTLSSYEYFKNNLEDKNTYHQYAPIDSPIIISKFLKLWKPRLAIFVESEIWPNMIMQASRNCKLILLNCRISKKSFRRWKLIKKVFKKILNKFDVILAQGEVSSKYLEYFEVKNIKQIGNIKFINSKKKDPNLIKINSNNNKWAAMSVHLKEFDKIIKAHLELKKIKKKITTFIIPRHLNKVDEMIKIVNKHNISYQEISKNYVVGDLDGVVILDKYGLADDIFNQINIVFMGGSLIDRGGQNPIEPLRYNCKILSGKFIDNFTEIYQDLIDKKLVTIVQNNDELVSKLIEFFNQRFITTDNQPKIVFKSFSDEIFDKTIKFLNNYIH